MWLQLLLSTVLLSCAHLKYIGDLTVYKIDSFSNPIIFGEAMTTRLDHFIIHPDTGDVYVGAVNYLYRLDGNLTQVRNKTTVDCEGEDCLNYNKVLVLQGGRLLECGSRSGLCQSRNEEGLNDDGIETTTNTSVVETGTATTESIIAPDDQNMERLYVATTFVSGSRNVAPVTRRELTSGPAFMFASTDDRLRFSGSYESTPFPITYVSVFVWNEFTYFVKFQHHDIGQFNIVSKIERVCQNSTNFQSHTEILIECSSGTNVYSLVQSAHIGPAGADLATSLPGTAGDQVLYAIFATEPLTDSALCIYTMGDIEEAFRAAFVGCTSGDAAFTTGYLQGSSCPSSSSPEDPFICDAGSRYQYPDGIDPLQETASAVFPNQLTSSIITTVDRGNTVAFIGTSQGQLLKVHIESKSLARLYEQLYLDGHPVMRDNLINAISEELYILTEQQLIKMRIENCGQYTTCETCIGTKGPMDGDPFCGWCTLERRCTRYNECANADTSTYWLPHLEVQCVEITSIAPNENIPITEQEQIILTVAQLPDPVSSQQYVCHFDDLYSNQAIVTGNNLTCSTPPTDVIPDVMNGEDHVVMLLSVLSIQTGVQFVDTNFSFYECSTHENCIACASSDWACDWCVFENRCTHNNALCTTANEIVIPGINSPESFLKGPELCPQLEPGKVLVPNNVTRTIDVLTSNLPNSALITSYRCVLDIEGVDQSVLADRSESNITCQSRSYTYTALEQSINVPLTILWTDSSNKIHQLDNPTGFYVTLYQCSVLRPDCSRCLSNVTSPAELECIWCGNVCDVVCSNTATNIVTPGDNKNCPNPVIQQVYPLAGPIEGNTTLTLSGTDLGLQFTDITNVLIGSTICSLEGLEGEYTIGTSVSCTTNKSNVSTPTVTISISGRDGGVQSSQGQTMFEYKDPDIMEVNPTIGPQSGGTLVNILGTSLNAGRMIEATISNMTCTIQRDTVLDNQLTCLTSQAYELATFPVNVTFDGALRSSGRSFTYAEDPTVQTIVPAISVLGGGRNITVNGTGFSIIQRPQMLVTALMGEEQIEYTENCMVENDGIMYCLSPTVSVPSGVTRRVTRQALNESINIIATGFIMDGVTALKRWSNCSDEEKCTQLEYVDNPIYYKFPEFSKYPTDGDVGLMDGDILFLYGENLDLAITSAEITVYVGSDLCTDINIDTNTLTCQLPLPQPEPGVNNSRDIPIVTVAHGQRLLFDIGYFRYTTTSIILTIVLSVIGGLLLFSAIILVIVLYVKSRSAQKNLKDCLDDIDTKQTQMADDMRLAFAELQTDVTDLTSDLEGVGMPFCSHREYATNMLFNGLDTKPATSDPEHSEEHVEHAMLKFSDLLNEKSFLLALVQMLDAQPQSKLPVRQKATIASLLTIVMMSQDKLVYLTDVLFTLMAKIVQDELDNERHKQLFRRTETILEKLLSNWIALCLYDSLQRDTAYPLFILYRAIKCHCESGPIDVISGQAKFTLSNEKLLTEDIDYMEMTLKVIVDMTDGETIEVKVLDVDTISQVKEKILGAIYRNKPYSSRPIASEVDLECHHGKAGRLVLKDIDNTDNRENDWQKVNTIKYYHIPHGSVVALVPSSTSKKHFPNSDTSAVYENQGFNRECENESKHHLVNEVDTDETNRLWHLTKMDDENEGSSAKKRRMYSRRTSTHPKKKIREIYITRLLSTKGTVEEYIYSMFKSILNADTAPMAVKYLFDFFDSQAVRHDIQDKNTVTTWKGNSLPLRFWSNAIRHPDYIFDVRPSRPVESSLGVIAQAFYDAHNASDQKLSKDSDLSKLLFNNELPRIGNYVSTFYEKIADMPRLHLNDLKVEMKRTCQNFTGLFSRLSTLLQLWECIKPFNQKIVEELEDIDECQRLHLPYKLTEVETTLNNENCDEEHPV